MTGHGQSQTQSAGHTVDCEIRAINNRYLKFNISWHERFAKLETAVQNLVRKQARRGTFYLSFRIVSLAGEAQYSLNSGQLTAYRTQAQQFDPAYFEKVEASAYLLLPGVIEELGQSGDHVDSIWPLMEQATTEAMGHLTEMRAEEGAAMAVGLIGNLDSIKANLLAISTRSPVVVQDYGKRLEEKLKQLLEPLDANITPADIVREVGVFADRSDISEEIVRLGSHLDQFRSNLDSSRGDGRKLEFVTQEMLRETNTIGSKANDFEIARQVVEIKTAIERIREMVQNIE